MEERKQSMVQFGTQRNEMNDSVEQEKRYKARINNNSQFIRTQNQVFGNISSVDRLIAYSLHQNCLSLSRVKHQQVLSLITKFNTTNTKDKSDGKKIFAGIIRNRFHAEPQPENQNMAESNEDYDMDEEDEEEEDDDDEEEEIEGNIGEENLNRADYRAHGSNSSSSGFSDGDRENDEAHNDEDEI